MSKKYIRKGIEIQEKIRYYLFRKKERNQNSETINFCNNTFL